jgi:hypothetical protein
MKFISFSSRGNALELGKPVPAKAVLPEWYKRAEASFIDHTNGLESDSGLKRCIPFLDGMIAGYMLVTPFDLFVSKTEEGHLSLRWNAPDDLAAAFVLRPVEQGHTIPRPPGYEERMVTFEGTWGWKLPRGWSALVIPPLNRSDLPFMCTSGIIDSDNFWANGSIPMFMRSDLVGTIPAGTPIAQIIPVKRAKWSALFNRGMALEFPLQGAEARVKDTNYKKKYWVRKEYR